MILDSMVPALAQWKERIEAAGKGFPTDVDLFELMKIGADLARAEEEACTCAGRRFGLWADGLPMMQFCACQFDALRKYLEARKKA